MSLGVHKVNGVKIKTKKALKDAIAEHGADNVMVFDTSFHDNRGTFPISKCKSADVIVLPDVYTDRRFYANFVNGKVK